jgi:hypothetical protein
MSASVSRRLRERKLSGPAWTSCAWAPAIAFAISAGSRAEAGR